MEAFGPVQSNKQRDFWKAVHMYALACGGNPTPDNMGDQQMEAAFLIEQLLAEHFAAKEVLHKLLSPRRPQEPTMPTHVFDQDVAELICTPESTISSVASELLRWRQAAMMIGCGSPEHLGQILQGVRASELEKLARDIYLHRGTSMDYAFEEAQRFLDVGMKHYHAALDKTPKPDAP